MEVWEKIKYHLGIIRPTDIRVGEMKRYFLYAPLPTKFLLISSTIISLDLTIYSKKCGICQFLGFINFKMRCTTFLVIDSEHNSLGCS